MYYCGHASSNSLCVCLALFAIASSFCLPSLVRECQVPFTLRDLFLIAIFKCLSLYVFYVCICAFVCVFVSTIVRITVCIFVCSIVCLMRRTDIQAQYSEYWYIIEIKL